ncbi:hypothetical protein BDV95DRAFT_191400 [Massariosphaeria phaeospora]|uniref:Uncharacterized protein n=1 Tax=Massariosphaeria phaeospora TaxID=100035 RepID=A0A7C8M3C1_9PLEO|nr:hypothetical protein BDV95DRAFT_191400 [Massariosphaeria phaeospora]
MGRGPKFSFPLPGRKSKADKTRNDATSMPSVPSIPQRSPRYDESSSYSKAERLLGTAGMPFQSSARQSPVPPSPGYMTITVSEASFGSDYTDKAETAVEDGGGLHPPKRPTMSTRPSSNILGSSYNADGRRGSNSSSISKLLLPRNSNSTMRSHYDPQSSPLSISQQTSESAVRDMALRKGKPPVTSPSEDDIHASSPLSPHLAAEMKAQNRKSKPPRLDLSKLFPKPKANGSQQDAGALLSPNKLVNSPIAMSTTSEYFPRPMTREPTPTPNGQAKLTRTAMRQQTSSMQPPKPASPVRLYERDMYDSAKIHVRRPPRGIKHWFDGFDEDSDEIPEEGETKIHAPKPVNAKGSSLAPTRLIHNAETPQKSSRSHQPISGSKGQQYPHTGSLLRQKLNSPSQISTQSQTSLVSTKTKESAFSKSNLQDSSVLSMSSSEDEEEDVARAPRKHIIRHSIDMNEDHGEIVIGKAQALDMRPSLSGRRPSIGKLSLMSTSTNAATIEVMYTPEPSQLQFPRGHVSRRSSHLRQSSIIPEDEQARPKTSTSRPLSPSNSVHSTRTSASEPRPRTEQQRLMAVTAEEEALLEMMRRKRAAMAQQNFVEGYQSAIQQDVRQPTPPPDNTKPYRTSAFLTTDTPSASPARIVTTPATRMPKPSSASPLLFPPPRGRPVKPTHELRVGTSVLRDSSSCDAMSDDQATPSSHASLAHHLAPPPEFSPLDPFPPPTLVASVASPTTTDLPSPLPSPITPGLRHGEADVSVKVAGSERSCNSDNDEVAVLDTGVIEPPTGSVKNDESRFSEVSSQRPRRRTASSGAEVPFSGLVTFETTESRNLVLVSEAPSLTPSVIGAMAPGPPMLPRKSSRRTSSLTVSTPSPLPPLAARSKHGSIISSRTSSPVSAPFSRRSSRVVSRGSSIVSRGSSIASIKRDSVAAGSVSTRCSVSEDVLAAWGNLGGVSHYDSRY